MTFFVDAEGDARNWSVHSIGVANERTVVEANHHPSTNASASCLFHITFCKKNDYPLVVNRHASWMSLEAVLSMNSKVLGDQCHSHNRRTRIINLLGGIQSIHLLCYSHVSVSRLDHKAFFDCDCA